jgi:hypothetical protein
MLAVDRDPFDSLADARLCRARGGTRPHVGPFERCPATDGNRSLRLRAAEHEESDMISETQIHTIARQMIEKHGFEAIAEAARNALACEGKGDTEEAKEWRHIEDAMKIMRGPHNS